MNNTLLAIIGKIIFSFRKIPNYLVKQYQLSQFNRIGERVIISTNCTFSENITIGNDVFIGQYCRFQSPHGKIIIGNHVMFGPGVDIHGGDHKFDKVGYLMVENSEKKQGEDGVITIEDDVWIGSNATILKEVTIGRGSIIGAGAIVTKDIPPYSIYTGIPTARLRERWDVETIEAHESILKKRKKFNE